MFPLSLNFDAIKTIQILCTSTLFNLLSFRIELSEMLFLLLFPTLSVSKNPLRNKQTGLKVDAYQTCDFPGERVYVTGMQFTLQYNYCVSILTIKMHI